MKTKADEAALIDLLRRKAQAYLSRPNITSVGVGVREVGGRETGELAIQFTVDRKLGIEELEAAGLEALPEYIVDDDGAKIPVDVIERAFQHEVVLVTSTAVRLENETLHDLRRSRLDTIRPGASICNARSSAGTVGAIVFDNETGEPYVLSNWHVLQTPIGQLGDVIVQPGPFDDSDIATNRCGRLRRSHLGLAGDCAICSIEGREFDESILEIDVVPLRVGVVNIGDRVVKSGRTTGVTRGIVKRVGVVAKIDYRGSVGMQEIGGFEIRPDSAHPPADGEISKGGDSGSLWLMDKDGFKDVAVGLHFAGETDPDPEDEHALACNIHSVLEKLKVSFEDRHVIVVDSLSEGLNVRIRWDRDGRQTG